MQTNQLRKELTGYVSRNVVSTLGQSLYILADTFFVANGVGPYGLSALNLALPIFALMNGLGLLLGMGGATLFSLHKSTNPESGRKYFSQLGIVSLLFGVLFLIAGLFFVQPIASLLGGDAETLPYLTTYLRVILLAGPFSIMNNFVLSFVRNDNNPHLTMIAMLASSLFNIFFDYLFVFPMQLGMFGAAFATALSPVLSLLVLSFHRKKRGRLIGIERSRLQFRTLTQSLPLGVPSFLTEMSTGFSLFLFNLTLLRLGGSLAVAAYGILANIAIVGLAFSSGTAQGIQPLVSREFGKKNLETTWRSLLYGLSVSLVLSGGLYLLIILFKGTVIGLFNSSQSAELANYAAQGLLLYLFSLIFSSQNVVISIFLASIAEARQSFTLVLLRGYILMTICLFLFSHFWGITGVWLSLSVTETLTLLVGGWFLIRFRKKVFTKKEL